MMPEWMKELYRQVFIFHRFAGRRKLEQVSVGDVEVVMLKESSGKNIANSFKRRGLDAEKNIFPIYMWFFNTQTGDVEIRTGNEMAGGYKIIHDDMESLQNKLEAKKL